MLTGHSIFSHIPNIVVEEAYVGASNLWNKDWNETSSGTVTLKTKS